MELNSNNELSAFYAFIGSRLQEPGDLQTPEECVTMWRTLHPNSDELAESAAAVKAALVDMAAGDTGRSAREILRSARQTHGAES